MELGESSDRRPAVARTLKLRLLGLLGASLVLLSACAPEEQTEYTQDTNTNFFAACSDAVTDSQVQVELCQCIYTRLEVTIPYQKLKVLDEELVADPELALQPEFVEIVANCIVTSLEQLS